MSLPSSLHVLLEDAGLALQRSGLARQLFPQGALLRGQALLKQLLRGRELLHQKSLKVCAPPVQPLHTAREIAPQALHAAA
jgi:hypothetical protein